MAFRPLTILYYMVPGILSRLLAGFYFVVEKKLLDLKSKFSKKKIHKSTKNNKEKEEMCRMKINNKNQNIEKYCIFLIILK